MSTANRNLKARPKATPSRIQADIARDKVILNRSIVDNSLLHVAETEALSIASLPDGDISVPLNLWLEHKEEILARTGKVAVQLAADEDPFDLSDDLADIDMIVLPFVTHADGRGYSHAYLLRERLDFRGEIRATGDVKFDQLDFLARVGCNAFELPDNEDLDAALSAFSEFSEVYQPSADKARLIFSKRRAVH